MNNRYEWGLLLLRVVLGISFASHGFAKFHGGIDNISNWFAGMGIPGILAYGVALLEVLGGLALIAGLATRIVTLLFAIVMIVAIYKVKLVNGFMGSGGKPGYELEFAFLTCSAVLCITGSRLYSVDQTLFPAKSVLKGAAQESR